MHNVTLRAVGGSVMVAIPRAILKALGWKTNARIGITVYQRGLRLEKPRYTLAQLIAKCDRRAPISKEAAAWDAAAPVGREVF
jgi:antitoxin ChpS